MKVDAKLIDDTGGSYDEIIFSDDYIPSAVYKYQISRRDEILGGVLAERADKALDLGCGTGFHLSVLMKKSSLLVACDLSLKALLNARRKHGSGKSGGLFFVVCDASNLPFKTEFYDFVWISGVLHHVPSKLPDCLSEVGRVTKGGGEVLINEPNYFNLINHINMKLSKADPTGTEKPLRASYVVKLLSEKNFCSSRLFFGGLLAPIVACLNVKSLTDFVGRLDYYISRTPLRLLCLRWTIHASKERTLGE